LRLLAWAIVWHQTCEARCRRDTLPFDRKLGIRRQTRWTISRHRRRSINDAPMQDGRFDHSARFVRLEPPKRLFPVPIVAASWKILDRLPPAVQGIVHLSARIWRTLREESADLCVVNFKPGSFRFSDHPSKRNHRQCAATRPRIPAANVTVHSGEPDIHHAWPTF
jgi:hypothetical protein